MYILAVILAYLIGSLHVGPVLARRKGVDLKKVGSGNIGFTNVSRALGWKTGAIVMAFDIAKAAATIEAGFVAGFSLWQIIGLALAVIIGNICPIFLKFRGGKGVATSIGVIVVLNITALSFALAVFLILLLLTRTVSIGSLAGALTVCLFEISGNFDGSVSTPVTVLAFTILFILLFTHRQNIGRLVVGKENKVVLKGT